MNNKKSNEKIKTKPLKLTNDFNINNTNLKNNIISSGNKKGTKLKRISTDINTLKYKKKYKTLLGVANLKNKPRETYTVPQSNIPLGNVNNAVKQLNKSIEGKNSGQFRFSKNSDMIKQKQKKNINMNNNKTKLITRVNLNKKENPFFNEKSNNINNNNFNSNI